MSKNKNIKKKEAVKTEKEKDIIKKRDFEDANENKKVIVVALILALLIGGFAYVRSLDKKEGKEPVKDIVEKDDKEEISEVVPEVEVPQNNYQNNVAPTPTVEEVYVWEPLKDVPVKVEAGASVSLPEVKDNEVVAVVTFKYRETEDDEYTVVDGFDTSKLGQHVVTYTLNYSDGRVEVKELVIEVEDTTEPVVNYPKEGKHYSVESILVDITEYSDYSVKLNDNDYDIATPITEEGNYTLVVTETRELGSSTTVTFTIDRTLPIINLRTNNEGNTEFEVVEENLDKIILTKNGEEIELTPVIVEDGEYKVVATDKAGNKAEKTFVIDTTAPVAEVTYTPVELTNEKVVVVITANEEIQEVAGWTLSEDKLTLTKEFTTNGKETVNVKDAFENVTSVDVVVNNIYTVDYKPELTLETLVTNQVKATITSLKKLTFNEVVSLEWLEKFDEVTKVYTYEKIYTETKEEVLDYSYEGEDGELVTGQIEIKVDGLTIVPTMVTYDQDETTQNVTVFVLTDEGVTSLPDGFVLDDEFMGEGYRYYKVYTDNVEYSLVEFVSENKKYVAAIEINSIDREGPAATKEVTYEVEDNEKKSVSIVVEANEELEEVAGWILSSDKKSISKVVERPNNVTEEEILDDVTISDLKGNTTKVEFSYNWNNEQSVE